MIRWLHIRNVALIDELHIDFSPALNIITGETGAGKSIIIGALGLILGERARPETIRGGAEKAGVEALFDLDPPVVEACRSLGIDMNNGELLLRRELSQDGRSKAYIDARPVPLSMFKELGDRLVDLHGQHQHQSLLKIDMHREFLDAFGENSGERVRVEELHQTCMEARQHLRDLQARQSSVLAREQQQRFELQEIAAVNPQPGEEEELERQRKVLENGEQLCQAASSLFEGLHQSEGAVLDRLGSMRQALQSMVRVDEKLTDRLGLFDEAVQALREVSDSLFSYGQHLEFDPERLEQIRDRLGVFSHLKRKYGSMDQVIDHRLSLEKHLSVIEGYGNEIAACAARLADVRGRFQEACLRLSERRRTSTRDLKRAVERELAELGMKQTQFEARCTWIEDGEGLIEVEQERYQADHRGMDRVEFFLSPNVGEELKPLVQTASGGEISRVMLALKSVLLQRGEVPTMVFDEIDIGIGGRVAEAVGMKLKRLAGMHQVVCITHLPQIASLSDEHYTVAKRVEHGRTVTSVTRLDKGGRIDEIARMLGGASITPTARQHALELIERDIPVSVEP